MNPLVQPDPGLFIWTILTFLVLLYILAKFAWKPLLAMLDKREETIRKSLDDAEKARLELEQMQIKSEDIIAQARSEAQAILQEGKAITERLKDDVLNKAKEKSDEIVANAQKIIQTEKDRAIGEIKSEAVDISISIARKLISKNLSKEDNKQLIEDALNRIQIHNEA
ncbi:MAG: F0F1 ATP synthase subunit B [Candidatus Marinimicrobia bacterium]|nr:F0F1 ATP synthase subunit B [Candidatus Neomarinimicrobiota bacterium]